MRSLWEGGGDGRGGTLFGWKEDRKEEEGNEEEEERRDRERGSREEDQ